MNRTLKRTLMDVRKMRRAVKLRGETDPNVVSQTLETILKEAIILTRSGEGAMSDAAIKELQQIRRALVAGQIDAGANTGPMLGRFSAVLDQINDISTEVEQEYNESNVRGVGSRLLENLPSADTIIAGVMTANPLLGYSIKIARDLLKDTEGSNKKRRKEELRLRKERLEAQEKVIEEQLKSEEADQVASEEKQEAAQEEKKQVSRTRGGIYKKVLEEIRDELKRLKTVDEEGIPTVIPVIASNNEYKSVFSTISEKLKRTEQNNNITENVDSVFSETDYKEFDNKEQTFYKDKNFYGSDFNSKEIIMKLDSTSISEVEKIISSANQNNNNNIINYPINDHTYAAEKLETKDHYYDSKNVLQGFIDSAFIERVPSNDTNIEKLESNSEERQPNKIVEKLESNSEKQIAQDQPTNNIIIEKLNDIKETSNDSNIQLEKIGDNSDKELAIRESETATSGLEQAEAAFESANTKKKPSVVSSMVDTVSDTMETGFGFLKGLFSSLKLLAGLKIAAVVGIIKGVYDFVDGMLNAGKILGLDNNKMLFSDRLTAAFSHMLSGILEPINWIYEFFGGDDLFNGESREDLTRRYFDFFSNFTDNMLGMIKWIFDSIVEKIVEVGESIVDYITPDFSKFIPDWLGGEDKTSDSNLIKEKDSIMPEWLPSWLGGDSNSEENNINDSNTNSVKNKTELNYNNESSNKVTLNESESPSTIYTSSVANDLENFEETTVDNQNKQNSTAIVAPVSNNQTNINQHQYGGSGSSGNREPSHRRFSRSNGYSYF